MQQEQADWHTAAPDDTTRVHSHHQLAVQLRTRCLNHRPRQLQPLPQHYLPPPRNRGGTSPPWTTPPQCTWSCQSRMASLRSRPSRERYACLSHVCAWQSQPVHRGCEQALHVQVATLSPWISREVTHNKRGSASSPIPMPKQVRLPHRQQPSACHHAPFTAMWARRSPRQTCWTCCWTTVSSTMQQAAQTRCARARPVTVKQQPWV